MAAKTSNLYLQISANADGLTRVAKAARLTLADLGAASGDLQQEMAKNFRELGGNEVQQSARQIEAAYRRTFSNIRAAAEESLGKPVTAASIVGGNIAGMETQLANARATATAYEQLADAQTRVAQASGGANAGERELAVILSGQALAAKESVVGLEQQMTTLRALRAQLGITADAEEELGASHTRLGASGMMAEHVVRAFTDSIAAGMDPVRAGTMQLGRITEAMTLYAAQTGQTEGAMGKFASFMGGPWGLAISVGVAVLVPLVEKLFEAGDAADDAKKSEEAYANYQNDLANFIDVANGKLRDRLKLLAEVGLREGAQKISDQSQQTKDLRDQAFAKANADAPVIGSEFTAERQANRKIFDPQVQAAIGNAGGDPGKLVANLQALAKTRPELQAYADSVSHIAGQWAFANQNLDKLKGNQRELTTLVNGGSVMSTEAADRHVRDRLASTPLEKAQARLSDVQARGRELSAAPYNAAAWKQYEQDLYAATKAVRALQQAQHDLRGRGQGDQSSIGDMSALLRHIMPGVRITSTTGGKHVANSDHYAGRAIDFVPAGGMGEYSKLQMKQMLIDAGVHIRRNANGVQQFFGPGDPGHSNHFHVAWTGNASPEALANRQRSTVRHDASTDQAYRNQVSAAQEAYARAQLDLTDTAQQRYNVELKSLQDRLVQRQQEITDMVTAGKIPGQTKAEIDANAEVLRQLAKKTEQLGQDKLKRDMLSSLLDKQIATARQQAQSKIEVLESQQPLLIGRQAQYSNAKSALDTRQAQEKGELAGRILNAAPNSQDALDAWMQLRSLPTVQANQQAALQKQYQSPLANYKDQLQSSVGDTNDALQNVGVDGLRNLEDGLTGVLTGTQSVSKAFKSMSMSIISDLARIGIEKAILGALGGSFFGIKLADGGKVDGHATGLLPSFAGGSSRSPSGMISGPGTGRSDSILAILGGRKPIAVSNGESIVTAKATKAYWPVIKAMNDNRLPAFANGMVPQMASLSSGDVRSLGRQDTLHIKVEGQEGPYFRPVIQAVSGQQASIAQQNATTAGADLAQEKAAWAAGRKLGGSR